MIQFPVKPRVLVVDDKSEIIDALTTLLEDEYRVEVALNGEKALDIALSLSSLDLILLDVVMPGMDGYEVCRRLKANQNTKEIPVLFLTSNTEINDIVKGFELGAVDYITKPFNRVELLARVRTHLERQNLYKQVSDMKATLEESDAVKSKIILLITSKIIPFTMEVLQATMTFKEVLSGDNFKKCMEIKGDGMKVMNLLRRVEALLKS